MILFDANVLVHAHAGKSPFYEVARRLRDQAAQGDLEACLTPQVLCEFFAVVTNARLFHPALTPRQASQEIGRYWKSGFRRIFPKDTTMPRLVELVSRHGVAQQHVFDAFLAATMLDNGVQTIYTQNVKDFAIYREFHVINPFQHVAFVHPRSG